MGKRMWVNRRNSEPAHAVVPLTHLGEILKGHHVGLGLLVRSSPKCLYVPHHCMQMSCARKEIAIWAAQLHEADRVYK